MYEILKTVNHLAGWRHLRTAASTSWHIIAMMVVSFLLLCPRAEADSPKLRFIIGGNGVSSDGILYPSSNAACLGVWAENIASGATWQCAYHINPNQSGFYASITYGGPGPGTCLADYAAVCGGAISVYSFWTPHLVCPPGEPQYQNQCGGAPTSQNTPAPNSNTNKGPCPICAAVENPINALVGNKYQVERDYTGIGPFPLVFERVYNSFGAGPGNLMPALGMAAGCSGSSCTNWTAFNPVTTSGGNVAPTPTSTGLSTNSPIDFGWRHNYDRTLTTTTVFNTTATLFRPDSNTRTFTLTNGIWVADSGELLTKLTQQVDSSGNILSWTYVNENDETETYDPNGKLLSITNRAGLTQTLQYNNVYGTISGVTDAFGRQMTFNYNMSGSVSSITTPDNGTYTFAYTADGNKNLTSVTYPDTHTRQYVYENTQYMYALTGIIDENGNRFATYGYDTNGNAILTEHAGGVDHATLTYPSITSTIATYALGEVRTFSSQVVNGIAKAGSIVDTCGTNCSRTNTMSYDGDGNISSSTDYNGNTTTYSYDTTRDLETSRTEASGTAQSRTITTQWHPTFRLPMVVSEPGRTTTYAYDTNGNMLTKTITVGGTSHVWTYTYNTNGQVLTVTGPRTDVADVTNYGYDTSGNLISIQNALGQVTTLANYDANGRVGLITDPNGATTALTYAPRGWLTSKIVTAGNVVQSTSYNYDNVGQLTQVTLPDSSTISYTYDPAHRLTNIRDSLGNSIAYTLDLMDNRTAETVTDPTGVLTRQVSRIFDSVNRLQQVTGAAQ